MINENNANNLLSKCPVCNSSHVRSLSHKISDNQITEIDEMICLDCGHAWLYRRANKTLNSLKLEEEKQKNIDNEISQIETKIKKNILLEKEFEFIWTTIEYEARKHQYENGKYFFDVLKYYTELAKVYSWFKILADFVKQIFKFCNENNGQAYIDNQKNNFACHFLFIPIYWGGRNGNARCDIFLKDDTLNCRGDSPSSYVLIWTNEKYFSLPEGTVWDVRRNIGSFDIVKKIPIELDDAIIRQLNKLKEGFENIKRRSK